jgi:MFS family permease
MSRIEWPALARALARTLTATFLLGTIALAIFSFVPLGTPPGPIEDFLERVVADFEYLQTIWPLEFAGTALFALGFLALAGLGPTIGRLADADDGRRGIVGAAFVVGGVLGAAAQLLWIGVRPVATNPQYCDCGLLAEEIMSRLMILDSVGAAQDWLVAGAILAAAAGTAVAGTLGREAGMPTGWLWLSWTIAALSVVVAVLPILRLYPFDTLAVVLVAGILFPIWALWLGARAWDIWPRVDAEEVEIAPAEV